MGKTGVTGWRRIWNAGFYSANGLRAAWKHESAFRQECVICLTLLPASFIVGTTAVERILLVGSLMLVLITELLNSAVEAAVDRVSNEHHTLSGQAKDMGSAAVLLSLLLAAFVWVVLLWQRWA